MNKFWIGLLVFSICNLGFSQDYFIKEDFEGDNVKYSFPFEPDWDKNFFIETEVKPFVMSDSSSENAGIVFGYDKTNVVFYALYIKNSNAREKKYKDYFKFRAHNVPDANSLVNNDVWQETSIINFNKFNRLQIYKIDNELFLMINDQVVYHVKNIQSKGNNLDIVAGQRGLYCNYVHAYYIEKSDSSSLKSQLIQQLEIYEKTGIHHKIAQDYQKVLDLQQPKKISKFTGTRYYPTEQVLFAGGSEDGSYFDKNTRKEITEDEFKKRLKTTIITNDYGSSAVIIKKPGLPVEILENYFFTQNYKDSLLLLTDKNYGYVSYNLETKEIKKLVKIKKGIDGQAFISDDFQYICGAGKVFSIKTGKEIEYKKINFLPGESHQIKACFNDKIIVKKGFGFFMIDLLSNEQTGFPSNSRYDNMYQNNYLFELNGRELSIFDLSKNQYIKKNIQILPFDRKLYEWMNFEYFPELNEVFVTKRGSIDPEFYFSAKDNVINTSAYIVNIETNEISPYLFGESGASIAQNKADMEALIAKSKIEVEQFLSQFKTFGNYYELNYDNFDYVNVSNNPFLNSRGIGGTTYVIGKFCDYNGGSLLALGVTKDQYSVELISISYGHWGIYVKREKLGITQIVNGYATQIASVKVYRNSSDQTKFTLVVNDGKETKMSFTSKCN